MKRGISQGLAPLCAAVCLWGCVGGTSAPTRYYVLAPTQPPPSPGGAAAGGPSVDLARIMLPEYLNQAAILTRAKGNEVQRAGYDLWAGSLSDEVTRTLGEDLSLALPTDRLSVGGTRGSSSADFIVEVEIVSFERDAADTVHLIARWSVLRSDGRVPVAMRRSAYQQSAGGSDYAETVAAMSRVLGDLSLEIAGTIKTNASAARGASLAAHSGGR